MEWNGLEHNGTEWDGKEQNGMEGGVRSGQSREAGSEREREKGSDWGPQKQGGTARTNTCLHTLSLPLAFETQTRHTP